MKIQRCGPLHQEPERIRRSRRPFGHQSLQASRPNRCSTRPEGRSFVHVSLAPIADLQGEHDLLCAETQRQILWGCGTPLSRGRLPEEFKLALVRPRGSEYRRVLCALFCV